MTDANPNPFDALDGSLIEPGAMVPGPPPSLMERFRANREAGYYSGTFSGAVQGKYAESFERQRAMERYESLPQWETPAEGLAALAGQLSSQINPFEAPENYTPVGLGEKILAWGGMALKAGIRARIAAGAIDAAAVNAVTDSTIQGIEIGSGTRESFDPVQLAASTALGTAVGGLGGGIGALVRNLRQPAGEPRITMPDATPQEAPGDDLQPPPPSIESPATPEAPKAPEGPQIDAGGSLATSGTATGRLAAETPGHVTVSLGDALDAQARIVRGLPPRPEPLPAEAHAPPPEQFSGYRMFSPDELNIDAKRFQFKEGGNDSGVSERLKGVAKWDPLKAGQIIVWEDNAGKFWVADGHQRAGLAARLREAGKAPRILGIVLREADGITAEQARSYAAAKNIAEGTGTALDAAKVMRSTPGTELNLPPQSTLVRDAQSLAKLSDDAFRMVVNKVVPENQAAIVGRLAPDRPDAHADILKVLADNEPANAVEAESMVRDALDAPQVQTTMEDMFGSAEQTQILYKERAQVLAGAAKQIKQDRSAFKTLVREEDRLTGAGNVLATESNTVRLADDELILAQIQKLARRAGPVADALATAARGLKDGKPRAQAISGFLDAVKRDLPANVERGPEAAEIDAWTKQAMRAGMSAEEVVAYLNKASRQPT